MGYIVLFHLCNPSHVSDPTDICHLVTIEILRQYSGRFITTERLYASFGVPKPKNDHGVVSGHITWRSSLKETVRALLLGSLLGLSTILSNRYFLRSVQPLGLNSNTIFFVVCDDLFLSPLPRKANFTYHVSLFSGLKGLQSH